MLFSTLFPGHLSIFIPGHLSLSLSFQGTYHLSLSLIMSTQHYFSDIEVARALIHHFLKFLLPVVHTIFFRSHWLLSHLTIIKTMDSSGRGMKPAAMTIINPLKKILAELRAQTSNLLVSCPAHY